jgi:predicted phosphate transport protein (TIGR00153 family)
MKLFRRRAKPDRFIHLLIQQAEFAVAGMQALQEFVKRRDEALAKRVGEVEKEADEVRRVLIDELNRTFVTPIDREDIFALSLSIDDILDYANTTIEEMAMLHVEPNVYIERMVSLLTEAAREILLSVHGCRTTPTWPTTTPCGPRRSRTAWKRSTAKRSPTFSISSRRRPRC